jgi:DNA polymerase
MVTHIDIETRSNVDISSGVHNYARAAEILILCWAVNDGPVQTWTINDGTPVPNLPPPYAAHNSQFERVVLHHCAGWDNDPTQWDCTATRARQHNIPASLSDCAKELGLEHQKDRRGAALIRKFSIGYAPTTLPEFHEFIAYCRQDVEVERAIHHALAPMQEPEVWHIDQKINDRGVGIDRNLVRALAQIDAEQRRRLHSELQELTGLENPNSARQLRQWFSDHGLDLPDMTKATIAAASAGGIVGRVLEIRRQTSQSASKKLASMDTTRAKGILQYWGAGNTGRWAGRRIQPQNMPRGSVKVTDSLIETALTGDLDWLQSLYGDDVQGIIGSLLRACIIGDLAVADYSAIEARVLAWLAGEKWVLDEFRGDGKIYEATAAQMYGVPKHAVTKEQRQTGKGATLGAGYAGGAGAVMAFGIAPEIAQQVVTDWRAANPAIVRYWAALESAAHDALRHPGNIFRVGPVAYRADDFGLLCRLPSGRRIAYPGAKLVGGNVESGSRRIWKGIWVENLVQAVARDLLADALMRCEAAGLTVVLHVHDEIVIDGPGYDTLIQIMSTPPKWAEGLPLRAEGYRADRYRK